MTAPRGSRSPHGSPARHGHHHRDRHGNPADWARYLARLLDPGRAAWQKPARLVDALGLRPGQTAAEIGAGPGYFTLRLARAVGAVGRVYAVDAEPRMLPLLAERLRRTGTRNVTPVLGLADDPLLPLGSCDVILVVDTYHHFPNGPAYLRRLVRYLKPGGRLVNVDFQRRETPVGPPLEHRVAREEFLRDARRAGLRLVDEWSFLPYQYALVLSPR